MNSRSVALALTFLAAPALLRAQVGVGMRVGTLGLGPEISLAAGNRIAVRGGIGFIPLEPKRSFSDIDYTLHPPSNVWNVGVDVYPWVGGLRFTGGFVHWHEYDLRATQSGSTSVGGQTYSGTVNIDAVVRNARQTAPYVMMGLGRTTQRGVGMFLDLGLAFIGKANIQLSGTCTQSNGNPCPATFQSDLEQEEADAEADVGKYLELLPLLQIGLKVGLGR